MKLTRLNLGRLESQVLSCISFCRVRYYVRLIIIIIISLQLWFQLTNLEPFLSKVDHQSTQSKCSNTGDWCGMVGTKHITPAPHNLQRLLIKLQITSKLGVLMHLVNYIWWIPTLMELVIPNYGVSQLPPFVLRYQRPWLQNNLLTKFVIRWAQFLTLRFSHWNTLPAQIKKQSDIICFN